MASAQSALLFLQGLPTLSGLVPPLLFRGVYGTAPDFVETSSAVPYKDGKVQNARTSRLNAGSRGASTPEAMRWVVDETGRRVEVPMRARRVVSLAPNVTDILYALGAGDEIAGITDFTDVPPGDPGKPSVGEPEEPSLEEIVALKPDLVLAGPINRWETVDSLNQLGIPVYGTEPKTVEDMLATIRHIAALIGARQAGEELDARLQARLDALRARLAGRKPKRVLFVVWEDPLITTGENTFIADALRWAGATSVIHVQKDWPEISMEEVVHLEPQDLIFTPSPGSSAASLTQSLRSQAGWRELQAVQKGHVLIVSDAINRASPPLVGAIEQLARELHPGAFAQPATRQAAEKVGRRASLQPVPEAVTANPGHADQLHSQEWLCYPAVSAACQRALASGAEAVPYRPEVLQEFLGRGMA